MKRRTFLAGMVGTAAAGAISMPAIGQSSKSQVLKFVPQTGLVMLDPTGSSHATTVCHSHQVYDQLYGVDSNYRAQPQMVEGHTVSSDSLTWELKLRPGLVFHDGERVLAKDAVASIERWWQRDAFGSVLRSSTDELTSVDDNTIRFRLNKPFFVLPDALAHVHASPLLIMPARIAAGDPATPITEIIGSGPFKFLPGEFVPGQRSVYERNSAYVPRQEAADGFSGGKVAHFERVEWQTITDFSTASAALQAGEIDWWEGVQFDLIEVLKANKDVTVTTADAGYTLFLRFNCGTVPFNNAAIRRAVAAGLKQSDFTQAIVGADPDLQSECYSLYNCLLPGVEQPAKAIMGGEKDFAALAQKVKEAGYNGEKVVVAAVTDQTLQSAIGPVVFDTMQKLGLNVELKMTDLSTAFQLRRSQAPATEGGWSMYASYTGSAVNASPMTNVLARGLGATGFAGNYEDQELETMIHDWCGIRDEAGRAAQTNKISEHLAEMMPTAPLGGIKQQTGFRSDLTGYLPNTIPSMWNIKRG